MADKRGIEPRPKLPTRYVIERELGVGGMAIVYLAHDQQHDRPVAVKVLRADVATASSTDRFLREIQITARLQHPLIAGLLDSGTTDEPTPQPFFVMPYIAGESLRDRLTRDGPLQVDEVLHLIREIGDALAFAHRTGLVHRDVKPENVLLVAGHAVVADFGIAHALRASHGHSIDRITQAGMSLGTPAYMSPEQATADPDVDPRSDQYSLACVLYEMLAGQPPFVAHTAAATIAQHVIAVPPSLHDIRPATPPGIVAAVNRALAKSPVDRFDTITAFLAALTSPAVAPAYAERSLVVLPFANVSPERDNEYFSDGLTEEIISDLSSLRGVRVISRTSSMRFKGTSQTVRAISQELGVRYVLEGSVRKAGTNLRINAQLIDAIRDCHLWSHKFSGTTDDIFGVQEHIAREIARALDLTLSSAEDRNLSDRPFREARAFDLYLRARALMWRADRKSFDEAHALLATARELEGENSNLLALTGHTVISTLIFGLSTDPALRRQASDLAARIIEIAPESADGYYLLGMLAYDSGDLQGANDGLKQTLARNRNHTEALAWIANVCLHAGRTDATRVYADALRAVDPLATFGWVLAAFAESFDGRFGRGAELMVRAVELQSAGLFPRWQSGYSSALNGDLIEAAQAAAFLEGVDSSAPYAVQLLALVDGLEGRAEMARERLAPTVALQFDCHITFHLAEAHAVAGDTLQALALVERAVATGFYPFAFISEHCPFLASLRREPKFGEILAETKRRSDAFIV